MPSSILTSPRAILDFDVPRSMSVRFWSRRTQRNPIDSKHSKSSHSSRPSPPFTLTQANLESARAKQNLGRAANTEAAKRHLDKLRSPPRRVDRQQRAAYRDGSSSNDAADQDKFCGSPPSFCYDSSSSTSTHPASPPSGSPEPPQQRQAAGARGALPPRARPSSRMSSWSDGSCDDDGSGDVLCPSSRATMRSGGRKLWRNELAGNNGEYAIRECPVEGEYIVEKIVPSTNGV